MGIEKVGLQLGKEIIAWTRSGKSLLATRPIKVNTAELKFAPQLEGDVVNFGLSKINNQHVLLQRLTPMFRSIKNKDGQEFVDTAYQYMVRLLDLKGIAPEQIIGINKKWFSGGFDSLQNVIKYSERLSKEDIINLIAHELTHCKQTATILRTEGLGAKEYAKALAENVTRFDVKSFEGRFSSWVLRGELEKARYYGYEKQFLQEFIDADTKKFLQMIESNFAHVLELPKIKADSPEGIKALRYLEGQRNYEFIPIIGGDKYKNNILEKEAYEMGDTIEKLYREFCT